MSGQPIPPALPKRYVLLLAVGLGVVVTTGVVQRSATMGLTWDEAQYIAQSYRYGNYYLQAWQSVKWGQWREALSRDTIDTFYATDSHARCYHPPFAPLCFGIAAWLGGKRLGWLTAARAGTAGLFGCLVGAVFLWTQKEYGLWAGLFAIGALVTMPRVFGHAQLAALDMPIAVIWFLGAAAFFLALQKRCWIVPFALLWGAALATKLHAILLPVPLALSAAVSWAQALPQERRDLARRMGLILGAAFLLSPLTLFVLWPWLWHDTLQRLGDYGRWILAHGRLFPVPSWYFGHRYTQTPWHYPLVMTLVTVPTLLLALGTLGAVVSLRSPRAHRAGLLALINACFILLLFMLPVSQKYNGVRLFLPLFPFLAVLAAVGFHHLTTLLENSRWEWWRRRRRLGSGILAAVALAPSFFDVSRIHPYELSYYNALAGGLKGAVAKGFEPTYWGEAVRGLFPYINENLPRGSVLWVRGANITQWPLFFQGVKKVPTGILAGDVDQTPTLRRDLRYYDDEQFDRLVRAEPVFVVLSCSFSVFTADHWRLYHRRDEALASASYDGVPLALLLPGPRREITPLAHPIKAAYGPLQLEAAEWGRGTGDGGLGITDHHSPLTTHHSLRTKVELTYDLTCRTTTTDDYWLWMEVLDAEGRRIQEFKRGIWQPSHPTSDWFAGDTFRLRETVEIPAATEDSGLAVDLGLSPSSEKRPTRWIRLPP